MMMECSGIGMSKHQFIGRENNMRGMMTPKISSSKSAINFKQQEFARRPKKFGKNGDPTDGQKSIRSNMTQFSNMSVGTFFQLVNKPAIHGIGNTNLLLHAY